VLKVFLATVGVLTLVMVIYGLVKEAQSQGLEPSQVVKLIPFILPDALRATIPATILYAVCTVFGRMAGSNEIVALKSLGISPMTVLWPVFVLTSILSLATVWLSEEGVPWGRSSAKRVVIESVEEIAYGMLRSQRSYTSQKFSIIVKRVDGRKLVQPTITFVGQGDSPTVTLTAESAELRADTKEMVLTIICTNGTVDIGSRGRYRFLDTEERAVPLDSDDAENGSESPPSVPRSAMAGQIARQRAAIERTEQGRAAGAAFSLITGDFAALDGDDARQSGEQLKNLFSRLHRLETESPRRWSNGFSCLCFALIGAPVAMWRRNADLLTSFFVCFLPILIIYYPLLVVGVDQAKNGAWPPYSVWLGNVVFIGLAVWLLRKVIRY
jgi:lipopolysaccharide export system permease protein